VSLELTLLHGGNLCVPDVRGFREAESEDVGAECKNVEYDPDRSASTGNRYAESPLLRHAQACRCC
jgi:hypothetical protein